MPGRFVLDEDIRKNLVVEENDNKVILKCPVCGKIIGKFRYNKYNEVTEWELKDCKHYVWWPWASWDYDNDKDVVAIFYPDIMDKNQHWNLIKKTSTLW